MNKKYEPLMKITVLTEYRNSVAKCLYETPFCEDDDSNKT
jgi:hypothetical protein